jgi:Tfp pilus assembly protein PilV
MGGFGLIELLIALTVLVVGILVTFGMFESSLIHLGRAAKVSTATSVGENVVENFRAVKYSAIGFDSATFATVTSNTTYTSDTACSATCASTCSGAVCDGAPALGTTPLVAGATYQPIQNMSGADGRQYRVYTYITMQTVANGRNVKKISVVVHDPSTTKIWARVISSFDLSTGQ